MRRVSCGWTPMTMPSSGPGRPFTVLEGRTTCMMIFMCK